MKHILAILLLLFVSFSSCKKEHERPEGAAELEYFECKLNGVDFVPTNIPFQCEALKFSYYPEDYMNTQAGYLVMGSTDCVNNYTSVNIRIQGLEPGFTGEINMTESTKVDSCFPFYFYLHEEIEDFVVVEKLRQGKITISEFTPRLDGDSPYGSISGTFEFELIDTLTTDTLRFTEGRFRFAVPNIW